jgi:hypothetical protein
MVLTLKLVPARMYALPTTYIHTVIMQSARGERPIPKYGASSRAQWRSELGGFKRTRIRMFNNLIANQSFSLANAAESPRALLGKRFQREHQIIT